MAKQELCRAVNIKLYNTQANNIKNNLDYTTRSAEQKVGPALLIEGSCC
jgi:hypothetical protein